MFGIGVPLHSGRCDERRDDAAGEGGLPPEHPDTTHILLVFFFVENIRFFAVFRFTEIDHAVGSFNDDVDLGSLLVFRVNAIPRIMFRFYAINSKILFDFYDIF